MSHAFSLKAEIIKCRMKSILNRAKLLLYPPQGVDWTKAAKQIQI